MRRSVQSKQVVCGRRPVLCLRWISSKIWLIMLNWQHLLDGMIPKHHQDLFTTPAFPAQGLSSMLVLPGKGLCRHHRFARALAHCYCRQWVPGRLIGPGVKSLDLKFYNKTPFLLWIVTNNGSLIIKYLWFVNFKYIFNKKKLRKNSSLNLFTPFHVLIRLGVIWKKLSRPLYHVHFTVIHTNSRHNRCWSGSFRCQGHLLLPILSGCSEQCYQCFHNLTLNNG